MKFPIFIAEVNKMKNEIIVGFPWMKHNVFCYSSSSRGPNVVGHRTNHCGLRTSRNLEVLHLTSLFIHLKANWIQTYMTWKCQRRVTFIWCLKLVIEFTILFCFLLKQDLKISLALIVLLSLWFCLLFLGIEPWETSLCIT